MKRARYGYKQRDFRLLKRAFRLFDHRDTYKWFEDAGVPLVTQDDQCVFPYSQDSNQIVVTFIKLARELGISVKTLHTLTSITCGERHTLTFNADTRCTFDAVAITTGGSPKAEGLSYLEALGHKIILPVPSLFTFNIPSDSIRELMGVIAENAMVSLEGTNLKASGALMITHWGMSGPVILKLSSYGARLSLESIEFNTMESKSCPNLYLAGEILDIDAITGGFNLQAAWTTAYVAAVAISQRFNAI